MQRRLLAVVAALLVAVVGFVLWSALRSDREHGVVEADADRRPAAAERAAMPPAVVAPSAEKPAPHAPELASPSVENAPLADPRELAAQGAVEFTLDVTWPEGVPADERAVLVVQGKSVTDVISRVPLTGGGRRTLYLPKDRTKGRVALEARYLYLDEGLRLDPAKQARALECAPHVGAWLRGRVIFPNGADPAERDVSNARVTRASSALDRGGIGPSNDGDFSRIADDGSYSLGGLAPTMRHWFSLDLPAFVPAQHTLESVTPGTAYDHDFVLTAGVRFSGRVVDEAGNGIAKVRIECVTNEAWGRYPMGRHADTASDGSFTLRGIEPKRLELHAAAKGYVDYTSDAFDCKDGDVRRDLAIVLPRGNSLAGVVRWADGKPADGAAVRITDLTASGEVQRFGPMEDAPDTKCDAEGKFTVTGLRDGPFDVVATATQVIRTAGKKRERKPWRATLSSVAANRGDLVCVLAPPIAVVGTVKDDLGAPVKTFTLTARPESENHGFGSRGEVTQIVRDETGAYRLEKLHPGRWQLSVEAQGYEESGDETVTVEDGEVELSFVCRRGASLSGVVLDPNGTPIAGAVIQTRRQSERNTWSSSDCATDTAGKFACQGRSAGKVVVWATHSAWAASEPEELELAPGGALTGLTLHLRVGGRVEVTVLTPPGVATDATRVSLYTSERAYSSADWATTDAAGVATFEHVAPGEYDAQASRNGDGGGGSEHGKVTVVDGRTATVVLGSTDAIAIKVTGTVRSGTRPLDGVQVSFWRNDEGHSSGGRWARTGVDGRYEVTLDRPGKWHAYFGRRAATQNLELDIPAQAEFVHDVTFGTASISGVVLDTRGDPVGGISVDLRRDGGPSNGAFVARADADEKGRWSFELQQPGDYVVASQSAATYAPGCADGRSKPFEIAEGQELDGLEIVLVAGGRLEVRLRGAARDEARMVQLVDGSGQSLGFRRVEPGADVAEFDGVVAGRCMATAAADSARSFPAEVDVVVGATRVVELELVVDAKLVVRLVDANGKPVEGWVRPGDPSAIGSTADSPARTEHVFGRLLPGKQTYGAKTASGATGSVSVELAAGESKTVEIVVGS